MKYPIPEYALQNIAQCIEDTSLIDFELSDKNNIELAFGYLAEYCYGLNTMEPPKTEDPLRLAKFYNFIVEPKALIGDWWVDNPQMMMVFTKDRKARLYVPNYKNTPLLLDPITKETYKLEKGSDNGLQPFGYIVYRSLNKTTVNFKSIWQMLWSEQRHTFIYLLLFQLLITVISLTTPTAINLLIGNVYIIQNSTTYYELCLLLSGLTFIAFLATWLMHSCYIRLKLLLSHRLQVGFWDRMINLPLDFIKSYSAGDFVNRANFINFSENLFFQLAVSTISVAFAIPIYLAMLFYLAPTVALFAIVLLLISCLVLHVTLRGLIHHLYANFRLKSRLTGFSIEVFSALSKLRIMRLEDSAFKRWCDKFFLKSKFFYHAEKLRNRLQVFLQHLEISGVIIAVIVFLLFYDNVALGSLVASMFILRMLFSQCTMWFQSIISAVDILPMYALSHEMIHHETEHIPTDSSFQAELTGRITMENVSFAYQSSERILKNISFTIEPGEQIGIVGPSGSGKSTLLKLLLGFIYPNTGHISYDDNTLSIDNLQQIRSQLGVVLQDDQLVTGSILENVTCCRNISRDEVWEVLELVCLTEQIKSMPMQLDTVIMDDGKTLSAGQRQCLLIARALLHRPKILLFDEATSQLDNTTLMDIQQTLDRLKITRISIAHRLISVSKADRIFVMDNGNIMASGTYNELLQSQELFKHLLKRQSL